ncbi:MAG: hypothetical protein M5U01_14085 [Ardenticatenaceae bacterium]|nr:hypothetical protein [Ardenticatenaceae bacterium]HBY95721.1 hypothetical protein [Chloroflexota bacterium]
MLRRWSRVNGSGYGETLRASFAQNVGVKQIVGFGHAPIFEDADVFPGIVVVRNPVSERDERVDVHPQMCLFPPECLGRVELTTFVRDHSQKQPKERA